MSQFMSQFDDMKKNGSAHNQEEGNHFHPALPPRLLDIHNPRTIAGWKAADLTPGSEIVSVIRIYQTWL